MSALRQTEVDRVVAAATTIRRDFAAYLQRFFPARAQPQPPSASEAAASAAAAESLYARTEAHIGATRELLERLEAALEQRAGQPPSEAEEQLREWLEAVDEEDAALDDVAATLEQHLGLDDDDDEEEQEEQQEEEKGRKGKQSEEGEQGEQARAAGNGSQSRGLERDRDEDEDEEDDDDIVSKAASSADAAPSSRADTRAAAAAFLSQSGPQAARRPQADSLFGGSPLAQERPASLRSSLKRQPQQAQAPLSPLVEAASSGASATSTPVLRRRNEPSSGVEPAVLDLRDPQAAADGAALAALNAAAAAATLVPPCPMICAEAHEALTEAELTTVAGERVMFLGGDEGTGWSMVENARGQQGFVPTDFLDLPVRCASGAGAAAGKEG